jgi:hypothetical protein
VSETLERPRKGALDPTKEAQAVAALKESLRALGEGDDEALLLDSIEGETSFYEVVDAILDCIGDDDAMADAIDARIGALKARKERFTKRIETNKALLEQAFITADLPKIERPAATLYLSNRAPKVIIETESDIPARFWKPADPVLDKKALGEALKARREAIEALPTEPGEARDLALAELAEKFPDIPGATLSNGTRSLSIRTA